MATSELNRPWKRRRSWRQYSVSTLLVVVTILSVPLGVMAVVPSDSAEQWRRYATREAGRTDQPQHVIEEANVVPRAARAVSQQGRQAALLAALRLACGAARSRPRELSDTSSKPLTSKTRQADRKRKTSKDQA